MRSGVGLSAGRSGASAPPGPGRSLSTAEAGAGPSAGRPRTAQKWDELPESRGILSRSMSKT